MLPFALAILFAFALHAQESRGTILGRVSDATAALIPGAKITARNVATGVIVETKSNDSGNYELPYLVPGQYEVSAEREGFSKAVRDGIQLRVGDRLQLDLSLQLGAVADSVVVTGETPLLQTATASLGMVMDERRARELPVVGGNAFYLTRLTAGVSASGGRSAGNPMDNGAATGLIVNGTKGGNTEVSLDGAPNMQETSAAFAPMQDLVAEYKVETTNYDASLGRAAGAVVNVSLKSGTNALHGSAYGFDSRIRAVPWFSNQYLWNPATGPVTEEKRRIAAPGWLHQRWGATLSGPIRLGKFYDGRNKSFWTFGYEGIKIRRQPTFFATVPTEAQRTGDFSALLRVGANYQIYDPATVTPAAGGRFQRQPLPGNILPASRISPIARNILRYIPSPNVAGTADFRQNFFGIQQEPKDYKSFLSRLDHNFSQSHRLFARISVSDYLTGVQQLPTIADGDVTTQKSNGLMVDDVIVVNARTILNLRASVSDFVNDLDPKSAGFDLVSLGLPQSLLSELRSRNQPEGIAFPNIYIDEGAYTELSVDTNTKRRTTYQTYQGTFTVLAGAHSLRTGAETRIFRENGFNYGNVAPRFEFARAWTRGPLDTSAVAPIGQGLASMMLGLPTGGRINNNASRAQQSVYYATYLQDDWKLSRKLTLNLGLRYEWDGANTERYNRSILGFDFASASPISAPALAAYSRAPIPEVAPAQFRTLGGLTFAGVNGNPRMLWNVPRSNFAPRVGLAYQVAPQTVIRLGYGLFYASYGADRRDVNQGGFNQPTNLNPSQDNGQTFRATLANPFPDGIELPTGASQGLRTFLGRAVTAFQGHPRTPYMQRWSFNVQRQLPSRFVVDLGYVGNRGTHLGVDTNANAIPSQYFSTSPVRDQPAIDFLNAQVASPFFGMPEFLGTGPGNQRVARSQLLRPYPHFGDITIAETLGYSWYHGLQFNVQRRMFHGFTLQAAYTWSKFMEAVGYLNQPSLGLEEVVSDQDYPQRLTVSGIYELPFGKGRRLGAGANRFIDAFIGGWQLQAWLEGQSGQALGFGNVSFYGNLADIPLPIGERSPNRWFNTDAGFERNNARALGSNIRTMSSRFTGVRSDGINNVDASLFKNFRVCEGYSLQFRMESFNAFNHVQFANPNTAPGNTAFGTVTGEKGHGQRQMTFALKLVF
ncbi:MAG: TonB-dependent receptor [Bryobacterales bacterium]|nr:TonB-dependent receptor [Bryobacterales bacterium]